MASSHVWVAPVVVSTSETPGKGSQVSVPPPQSSPERLLPRAPGAAAPLGGRQRDALGGFLPQEAAGQAGHTQSLPWARGRLLGVQLPFPAPHLQRPGDAGSHSSDSAPREQFSEGLISQPRACSALLPSLSLVPVCSSL